MPKTTKAISTTSIHPITKQELVDGVLPSGTSIVIDDNARSAARDIVDLVGESGEIILATPEGHWERATIAQWREAGIDLLA